MRLVLDLSRVFPPPALLSLNALLGVQTGALCKTKGFLFLNVLAGRQYVSEHGLIELKMLKIVTSQTLTLARLSQL